MATSATAQASHSAAGAIACLTDEPASASVADTLPPSHRTSATNTATLATTANSANSSDIWGTLEAATTLIPRRLVPSGRLAADR